MEGKRKRIESDRVVKMREAGLKATSLTSQKRVQSSNRFNALAEDIPMDESSNGTFAINLDHGSDSHSGLESDSHSGLESVSHSGLESASQSAVESESEHSSDSSDARDSSAALEVRILSTVDSHLMLTDHII